MPHRGPTCAAPPLRTAAPQRSQPPTLTRLSSDCCLPLWFVPNPSGDGPSPPAALFPHNVLSRIPPAQAAGLGQGVQHEGAQLSTSSWGLRVPARGWGLLTAPPAQLPARGSRKASSPGASVPREHPSGAPHREGAGLHASAPTRGAPPGCSPPHSCVSSRQRCRPLPGITPGWARGRAPGCVPALTGGRSSQSPSRSCSFASGSSRPYLA